MKISDIIARIVNQETLTRATTHEVMLAITRGEVDEVGIAAYLTALQMRGITADEILGFRDALLETGISIDLSAHDPIDIVGTGGDGKNTFNISTCACFVAAGAGYKVAKHGNYAATSASGASNLLEHHGVKFTASADRLNASLERSNVAYMHAPLFAKGMKHVAPVRRKMGIPTCFNLLGPLINPARPRFQLLGLATLHQMRLYKQVLEKLGMEFGLVNSIDGYDEISLTSDFKVQTRTIEQVYSPSDFGFATVLPSELYGGRTVAEAAKIFDNVLAGEGTEAQTRVVAINAAFAINTIAPHKSVEDCLAEAFESIRSGKARQAFANFVNANND